MQAGQLKVPPGYHPLDVEKEWGKLHVAILEREKQLRSEFERWAGRRAGGVVGGALQARKPPEGESLPGEETPTPGLGNPHWGQLSCGLQAGREAQSRRELCSEAGSLAGGCHSQRGGRACSQPQTGASSAHREQAADGGRAV